MLGSVGCSGHSGEYIREDKTGDWTKNGKINQANQQLVLKSKKGILADMTQNFTWGGSFWEMLAFHLFYALEAWILHTDHCQLPE